MRSMTGTKIDETAQRIELLERIIQDIEPVALSLFRGRQDLVRREKSRRDYVSEADHRIEQTIRSAIQQRFPEDVVVGEEMGGDCADSYWLVDPIDGTSNFLSGLALWAVSVAYVEQGHPSVGAIAIPVLGRRLIGGRAHKLKENSRASVNRHGQSLVFGIGRNDLWQKADRLHVETLVEHAGFMPVTFGSCAVSLALCAAGELAGYAEGSIGFWDCAAGVALCEAAALPVAFEGKPGPGQSRVYVAPAALLESMFSDPDGQDIYSTV